jgi:folate-binding protein YgfZ
VSPSRSSASPPGPAIRSQLNALREGAGIWRSQDWRFLSVLGPEAATWLQGQTSNDVAGLSPGEGCLNSVLDPRARTVGVFGCHAIEGGYLLCVEAACADAVYRRLDQYLIAEQVSMTWRTDLTDVVAVEGPRALGLVLPHLADGERLPVHPFGVSQCTVREVSTLAINRGYAASFGLWFCLDEAAADQLHDRLLAAGNGLGPIGEHALESARICRGSPRFGLDYDEKLLLPETGLDRLASHPQKGCYVGQEVITRMRQRGVPKLALRGLLWSAEPLPPLGAKLRSDGKRCGHSGSATWSLKHSAPLQIAYLGRTARRPGQRLSLSWEGGEGEAEVVALESDVAGDPEVLGEAVYQAAYQRFHADLDDSDPRVLSGLAEAVALHPTHWEAQELYGVALQRHGQLDAAITVMERLAGEHPRAIMPHTNLSLLYAKQGRIEEAEAQKATAVMLGFKQDMAERKSAQRVARDEVAERADLERKKAMFEEVLEIDAEDPVASFGLGKILLTLEQAGEALPHLRQAVATKPDYSAAWLSLGGACEKLGATDEAISSYRSGIEAASRVGDLAPMRSMARSLEQLEAGLKA